MSARRAGSPSLAVMAVEVGSAALEVAAVFAPLQLISAPARGLWAVLAMLLLLAAIAWGVFWRRAWAPLRRAVEAIGQSPRGGPSASEQAVDGYLAGVRLPLGSVWLRTALLVAVSAVWGVIGVLAFQLPPTGLLLALWTAALATPHLDAWRALLVQRDCDRLLQRLARDSAATSWLHGAEGELRRLRDTFRERLILTALRGSGLFGGVAVYVAASSAELPLRGQLELWWWLPPPLLTAALGWMAWLRVRARPIERYLEGELAEERAPVARSVSAAAEFSQALRTTQRLPYELAAALWLTWTGAALAALLLARSRFALGITGVLAHLLPVALVLFAGALYQVPYQQATLAPLWPRLSAQAPRILTGRTPRLLSLPLLLGGPVAVLLMLWEGVLGVAGGGQPGRAWLAGAILVAAALGGTLWLLRDALRPLRTDAIAASLHPLDVRGNELGRLAAAFTAMQRALGERLVSSAQAQQLLERQVSARTVELQRRNEELQGALGDLQQAQDALLHTEHLASIGRLLAGIAHEINNPINAVVNTAAPLREALQAMSARSPTGPAQSLAQSTELLSELPAMLRVIERGAQRTQQIVLALHSYADREPSAGEPVDLNQVLAEALELVQHPAKPTVAITRQLAPLPPVVGDTGQLQQVFINLLSNALYAVALRAASEGADYLPRIDIAAAVEGELVRVAIRDNGPGIAATVRRRIFDPFFTTKDASSGTGLGLAIAHSIVSRHRGAISVTTVEGDGATFTVTLPAWAAAAS